MTNNRQLRPATQLVHGGITRSGFGETSEAIYLTQGFVYDSSEAAEARFKGEDPGFIYSRYANPTNDMFEKRMCLMEGAEDARATASGMAAISAALLCQLKAGDHVVSARALFGSCRWVVETLLPQYGIESTLVDGRDLANFEAAIRPNTKVFFLESPTNPTLEVVDIAGVARSLPTRSVRPWLSTMCSQRRFCKSRWNWARMWSAIPPPSTLTARAAVWAG
jgi:O-succinylhomoserine sulfhydrylase